MTLRVYGSAIVAVMVGALSIGWAVQGHRTRLFQGRSALEWESQWLAAHASHQIQRAEFEQNDLVGLNHLDRLTQSPHLHAWMVLDHQGRIRWHSDPHQEGQRVNQERPSLHGFRWFSSPSSPLLESWYSFNYPQGAHGLMVVVLSSQRLQMASRQRLLLEGAGSVCLSLLGGLLFWVCWRSVSRAFQDIQENVRALFDGLSPVWAHVPFTELRSIQATLREFADHIQDRQHRFHQTHQEISINSAKQLAAWTRLFPGVGFIALNEKNRVMAVTPAAQSLLASSLPLDAHALEVFTDPGLKRLLQEASEHKNKETSGQVENLLVRVLCVGQDGGQAGMTLIAVEPVKK